MVIQKLLRAFTLLGLPIAGYTCDATWVGVFGGNWSVPTNWSSMHPTTAGCVPGSNPTVTDDKATLSGGNQEIIQNLGPISLLSFTFENGGGFQVSSVNGGSITFRDPGASVNVNSSSNFNPEFNNSIIFNTDTSLNINGSGNQLFLGVYTLNSSSTLTYKNLGGSNLLSLAYLTSGSFLNQNNNPHTNTGNTVSLVPPIASTLNTGSTLTNQNLINGTINNANSIGVFVNASITITLNGGSIINENAGSIGATTAGATGAETRVLLANGVGIIMNSGTITNSNTGPVTGISGTPSFGSSLIFGNPNQITRITSFNIKGGTVTNNNSGTVDAFSFGSLIQVVSTSAAINIGSPSGTLINNDTVQGHVNITTGGTLSGTGLYTGFNKTTPGPATATTVTNTGGNVLPDNSDSPGTMTINGTYTQGALGTYTAELLSNSTFSKLDVLGTANIAGNLIVDFLPGNTVTGGSSFTVLQANTLNGSDFNVTYQNLPTGFTPTVTYTFGPNGTVVLSFIGPPPPPPPPPTPVTLPTSYAGGFLDNVLSGINHINSHITLRMEDLRRRFSASLENYSIAKTSKADNFIAARDDQFLALNREVEEKQELLRREVTGKETTKPWNFYLGPIGRAYGELHGRDNQPGARFWSVGGLIGFDYAFSEFGIGLLADYERIYNHVKENWGKIHLDEFQGSAYFTYAPYCLPELSVYAIAGGAYEKYHISRNTGSQVAIGSPKGFSYDGLLGIEYVLGTCNLHFIPLANAQYCSLRSPGTSICAFPVFLSSLRENA